VRKKPKVNKNSQNEHGFEWRAAARGLSLAAALNLPHTYRTSHPYSTNLLVLDRFLLEGGHVLRASVMFCSLTRGVLLALLLDRQQLLQNTLTLCYPGLERAAKPILASHAARDLALLGLCTVPTATHS